MNILNEKTIYEYEYQDVYTPMEREVKKGVDINNVIDKLSKESGMHPELYRRVWKAKKQTEYSDYLNNWTHKKKTNQTQDSRYKTFAQFHGLTPQNISSELVIPGLKDTGNGKYKLTIFDTAEEYIKSLPAGQQEEAQQKLVDIKKKTDDNPGFNPAAAIALLLIGYGLYKAARWIFNSDSEPRRYRRYYYE